MEAGDLQASEADDVCGDDSAVPSLSSSVCRKCNRGGEPSELSTTPFRLVEKRYKLYQLPRRLARRRPREQSDFSDVVDFHNLDANSAANRAMIHHVYVANPELHCYTFAGVPGLLVFANVLSEEEQVQWCREAILSYGDSAQHPNILSTHAKAPQPTTCYQPPMRWATLGFSYEWTSKTYHRDRFSSFPPVLASRMRELMQYVARVNQDEFHCSSPDAYEPQTAIVNYYPVGSMMMCHQDVSEEVMDQPLVSLSLGCSAVFLMGGQSREEAPHAFWLRSGDVAAFVGPARTAFHSTPRIVDDCPDYLTVPEGQLTAEELACFESHAYYRHHRADGGFVRVDRDVELATPAQRERYWRLCMRHMRVNINARQVYRDPCPFLFTDGSVAGDASERQ